MKHTIAVNKQLFNAKQIAYSTELDNLADGQLGIFPTDSTQSVAAGTTYATLPAEFRIVAKLGGKTYYSFDDIKKVNMVNFAKSPHSAGQINIWKTIISACECIKSTTLKIEIADVVLNSEEIGAGDSNTVTAPKELTCNCDCTGKPVYDNHITTRQLYKKVNAENSPYYEAEIQDLAGTTLTDAQVDAFIAANKAVNTDDDDTNDSDMLVLIIKSKLPTTDGFADIDINHVSPHGVSLTPSLIVNSDIAVLIEEIQNMAFPIGKGCDLREEEFESMSLFTNLNYHVQDGREKVASKDLIYQFENGVDYDVINFEFYTNKTNKNDGDKRSFGVSFGTETPAIYTALVNMFEH